MESILTGLVWGQAARWYDCSQQQVMGEPLLRGFEKVQLEKRRTGDVEKRRSGVSMRPGLSTVCGEASDELRNAGCLMCK